MNRLKPLIFASVVALMAVYALPTSASALPAYFECKNVGPGAGSYTDAKCQNKTGAGTGKFEAVEGIGKGKPFEGKAGESTFHTPVVGGEIFCKSGKETGALTSPTSVGKVTLALRQCEVLRKRCTSPGATRGTIQSAALAGTLGYISRSPLQVGVDLSAEAPEPWAAVNCEGLILSVEGSLIAALAGDVDVFAKDAESSVAVTAEGSQSVTSFEGGPTAVLATTVNGSGPFESGVQATFSLKGENLEILG
jgi:hypothetical protein